MTRALHRAGVALRPRGAGRFRPLRRPGDPPGLGQLVTELYEVARLSSRQIAAITGVPERTVRDRLRRYGIQARSRGGWNREDRRTVPAETLRRLYWQLGMTAAEVGRLIGASRTTILRSAHDLGVPVRAGGTVPVAGADEIELVRALYADDLITSVLDAHGIAQVPPIGPIWATVPGADSAEYPPRQGPVLLLRGRTEPHRAAHRAARHDCARVHAPRGHPIAASRWTDPVPAAMADGTGAGGRLRHFVGGRSSANSSRIGGTSSRWRGRHRLPR